MDTSKLRFKKVICGYFITHCQFRCVSITAFVNYTVCQTYRDICTLGLVWRVSDFLSSFAFDVVQICSKTDREKQCCTDRQYRDELAGNKAPSWRHCQTSGRVI